MEPYKADSTSKYAGLGLVTPKTVAFNSPLMLASGQQLNQYQMVYETYGELNKQKSNAILVCHALNANHHAAGWYEGDKKPGWWDHFIGSGKAIDTRHFFIVSPNNIGGCGGTTGPASINPETNRYWGADFPSLRVRDWVNAQKSLMDYLDIPQWAAIVGGSLGGMQVMRWSLMYPELLRHGVVIASTMNLGAQNIAYNQIARRAIKSDLDFCQGNYLNDGKRPVKGLALARMLANLTYQAEDKLDTRFGRQVKQGTVDIGLTPDVEYEIESYVNYQGDKFAHQFDANTYLLINRMLDLFDLARDFNDDPIEAFRHALCKYLVVSFSSDWRFTPDRSRDIAMAMMAANKSVSYAEIESSDGHDSFLLPNQRYEAVFKTYLDKVAQEVNSYQ